MKDSHHEDVAVLTMAVAHALAETQSPNKQAVVEALVNNIASAIFANRSFGLIVEVDSVAAMIKQRLDGIGGFVTTPVHSGDL